MPSSSLWQGNHITLWHFLLDNGYLKCNLLSLPSTQLAFRVEHSSYALIIGFNTFLALGLQTLLTLIVADEHVLNLPIRTQVSLPGSNAGRYGQFCACPPPCSLWCTVAITTC